LTNATKRKTHFQIIPIKNKKVQKMNEKIIKRTKNEIDIFNVFLRKKVAFLKKI